MIDATGLARMRPSKIQSRNMPLAPWSPLAALIPSCIVVAGSLKFSGFPAHGGGWLVVGGLHDEPWDCPSLPFLRVAADTLWKCRVLGPITAADLFIRHLLRFVDCLILLSLAALFSGERLRLTAAKSNLDSKCITFWPYTASNPPINVST